MLATLKPKKSVVVAETPSAVFHYSEGTADETVAGRKTDAIFRAAKQDLLTLMRLDVSALALQTGGGSRGPTSLRWQSPCWGRARSGHRCHRQLGTVPGTPARMLVRVKVTELLMGSPSHAHFSPFFLSRFQSRGTFYSGETESHAAIVSGQQLQAWHTQTRS